MKRYSAAAWLAAPLFAGLVLAACGDDKPAPGTDTSADTSTPDTSTTDTTETDTTPDTTQPDTTPDVADPCAGKTLCATAGERSCAATPERIVECQADNDGCLVLTTVETCESGEACDATGTAPECIDPCADIPEATACDTANARRCSGDTLETCAANDDGCLVFSATADCAAGEATNTCGAMGETVACLFDVCKGQADCTPGAACDGDTLNTCSTNAFGCLVATSFDCADAGATCNTDTTLCSSGGDPCDGVAAELVCDPGAGSMCNPADVFQLWTCTENAFGCPVWTPTDCDAAAPAGFTGYCDGTTPGAAACKVDLADRCEGKTLCSETDLMGANCDAGGTTLTTCAYDEVGCIVKTTEVCATTNAAFVCVVDEDGDDSCALPCEDACIDGAVVCTDDVISTCVMGESGCYELTVAGDCASIGWVCAEVDDELTCVLPPPIAETEPNDACEFANALNASGRATGGLTSGDSDWYSFEITDAAADVRIETLGATFTGCGGDTLVTLYASDCTTVVGDNDDEGNGLCSLIDPRVDDFAVLLEPGVYYVEVQAFGTNTIAAYGLEVTTGLPECGNGDLERDEACDDGNDVEGDGCSNNCEIQQGWSCSGSPSFCFDATRGDTCANAHDLDAWLAGANSRTFTGFDTTTYTNDYSGFSGTTCPVNGGTGGTGGAGRDIVFSVTVQPGEILTASMPNNSFDEFIALLNDCSSVGPTTCLYADDTPGEVVYTNTTEAAQTLFIIADGYGSTGNGTFDLQVSLRTPACGDGIVENAEQCDGGPTGTAGCNATTCQIEAGFVCAGAPSVCVAEGVGNTCATAPLVTAGTYTGSLRASDGFVNTYNSYSAPCSTSSTVGNDRVYAIEVPNNHQLSASYTSTGFDGVLVLSSSCDALTSQCLARRDSASSGGTETATYTNNSGSTLTMYVVLDAFTTTAGDFSLTLGLTDLGSLTFESEPNGTCAEADSVNLEDRIIGSINPGSDVDFFVFTLAERRSVTIETGGSGGIGSTCPGDTRIDLYSDATCATATTSNDDATGIGLCSRIVRTLDAGTYRVRVRSFGSVINDYSLNVVTAPAP